jgi:signal transduction histidine kinase
MLITMAEVATSNLTTAGWRNRAGLAVVVVGGLVVTAAWGWTTRVEERRVHEQRLQIVARESRTAVQRQVNSYAETLFGLRNLFNASSGFSRLDFRAAVTSSGIFRRFPGARALTFIRAVSAATRREYEARVQADLSRNEPGHPEFLVHPETDSQQLFVVEYADPPGAREVALGYDVGTDPVRRAALEEARDSGDVAATAPVRISTDGPGFLIFLSVYDTRAVPLTSPARRRHFVGVLSAVFQVPEMLDEVLGAGIRNEIEIFDMGRTVDPPARTVNTAQILFDADRRVDLEDTDDVELGRGALDLDVGTRRWRLVVLPRGGPDVGDRSLSWVLVVAVGVLLTALMSGLVFTFGRSRRLAIELADEMTASLRHRERQLEETNERLARANVQLAEADETKKAFLSTISHELQTPLTAIRGFSDLLLAGDASGGEQAREYAGRIVRNARLLAKLINELLDFSRLDRGETSLSPEPLSLSELAPRAVETLGPVLDGHHLQLDVEPDVIVLADPDAVTRIVTNLLANAVKFSPSGSVVEVAVTANGTNVLLAVSDEGPGIPDDERDRVFERFFRGKGAEVTGTRGTGLGLAVVKELAERMGGSVGAENRPEGGARFTVVLPRP